MQARLVATSPRSRGSRGGRDVRASSQQSRGRGTRTRGGRDRRGGAAVRGGRQRVLSRVYRDGQLCPPGGRRPGGVSGGAHPPGLRGRLPIGDHAAAAKVRICSPRLRFRGRLSATAARNTAKPFPTISGWWNAPKPAAVAPILAAKWRACTSKSQSSNNSLEFTRSRSLGRGSPERNPRRSLMRYALGAPWRPVPFPYSLLPTPCSLLPILQPKQPLCRRRQLSPPAPPQGHQWLVQQLTHEEIGEVVLIRDAGLQAFLSQPLGLFA